MCQVESTNVIKYQLSNEHYKKLGWTTNPVTKSSRKIMLYEIKMIKSHLNWSRLITGPKYYSNNVTPFIHNEENNSTIFYPTGKIAIKLQKALDKNYDLFMVFQSKSINNNEENQDQTHHQMIAAFDILGNGIILDEKDEIRLTFNQIGGICFDKRSEKIPVAWTWSKCNVKPIMVAIYMEEAAVHLEKVLQKNVRLTSKSFEDENNSRAMKNLQEKNSSIENAATSKIIEKNRKLIPIKTICLKINNFISLRILDRRNINLQYFAGNRNIRIELGFDVNFNNPLNFLLDDSSWGSKGFLRCRFQDELINNWIYSKNNLLKLLKK
ncbi:hypothetical protein PV327_008841 [Microctonus hyperodae]|uniref:FAM194 C-terminal domain-containing protein n=1 Tax=Microctonus hyperodae TaxID=165561 RepID=A0AA39FSK1_MICHY|nr:hypothetical protein PV327_008841 [Microctonus hyperodae]